METLDAFAGWVMGLVHALLTWLKGLAEGVLVWAYGGLVDALLSAMALLDALLPAQLVSPGAVIDGPVAFFLAPFRPAEGLAILGAAYLVRFLIRRLPVIG
jgi:hypothetical protein